MKSSEKNALKRISFYFVASCLFFLLSCGLKEVKIDDELRPIHDWYFDLVDSTCRKDQYIPRDNYEVRFVPGFSDPYKIGECLNWGITSKREISISRKWWVNISDEYRYTLIAHELTHCFFNEDHFKDSSHFMYHEMIHYPSVTKLEIDVLDYLESRCK